MEIVFVGLGKMGSGMGRRLLAADHVVHGHDPDERARAAFADAGGRALASLDALRELAAPRCVWLMVPAGRAVDDVLDELEPLLAPGDLVVDGGNSFYKDSQRRAERLAARGLRYVDCGTSGGVWGLEEGFCLMAGGSREAVEQLRPALESLAPAPDRGWSHVGPSGAGHFVKMVHNGIEYGVMQAYAEGFGILQKKSELGLDPARIAETWRHGSVVRSWLLDLTARALASGEVEGLTPWVDDSGEGRWTVSEAIDLDVPAPVISLALIERLASREKDSYPHKLLAAMRNQFGGHAVRRSET